MGTRADFYVGRGVDAEWIGSIAWDGYPEGIKPRHPTEKTSFGSLKNIEWPEGGHLFAATTPEEFRERVAQFFANRDDVTLPEHGWPWPWETSSTTDYAYALDGGKVWASCFGHTWFDPSVDREDEIGDDPKTAVFPDMTAQQNVRFDKGSGVMFISVPKA